jgi:hypothetical protein
MIGEVIKQGAGAMRQDFLSTNKELLVLVSLIDTEARLLGEPK